MSEQLTNDRLLRDYELFLAGKIVGGILVKEEAQNTTEVDTQRLASLRSAAIAEEFDTEQDRIQAESYANTTSDNVA